MNLFIVIGWISAAWAVEGFVDQSSSSPFELALADHCGVTECTPHDTTRIHSIRVSTKLEGSGFHRTLRYSATSSCTIPARHSCQFAILQPLPAAIYANIYELDAASAAGRGPHVRLFGTIDVESIEKFAEPTAVAVYVPFDCSLSHSSSIEALLPLHARYLRPIFATKSDNSSSGKNEHFGLKTFWKSGMQQHVEVGLAAAKLLLECSPNYADEGEEEVHWQQVNDVQADNNIIIWSLPVGNLYLARATACITAAVVTASALYVLQTVFSSSSPPNKRKKT